LFLFCGATAQIGPAPLFYEVYATKLVTNTPIIFLWISDLPVTGAALYTTHNKHKI
jgi:hypothetical protein